jgi:hypothetical protein
MFGARLCAGGVDAICKHASDALGGPCDRLRDWVLRQAALHVDETGWRTAGDSRALWTMRTPSGSLFEIAGHARRRLVARADGLNERLGGTEVDTQLPLKRHGARRPDAAPSRRMRPRDRRGLRGWTWRKQPRRLPIKRLAFDAGQGPQHPSRRGSAADHKRGLAVPEVRGARGAIGGQHRCSRWGSTPLRHSPLSNRGRRSSILRSHETYRTKEPMSYRISGRAAPKESVIFA